MLKNWKKQLGALLCLCWAVAVTGAETLTGEMLHIDFNRPQTVSYAGNSVKLDGEFTADGFWKFGKRALDLPAQGLFKEKGTLFVRFKQSAYQDKKMTMRFFVTVRDTGTGRFCICFYTGIGNGDKFILAFADNTENAPKYYYGSPAALKPDQIVAAAISWDGETLRVYQDGVLREETKQPLPIPADKLNHVYIGPFVDGSSNPEPWADDSCIASLRLFSRVLSPEEVAQISGVKPQTPAQTMPSVLAIPEIKAENPALDGKLSENFWNAAASLPELVDGSRLNKGWTLPANNFRMAYDQTNLYLGFTTRFPDMPEDTIVEGEKRTATREPEVWGSESFEFYLKNGKDIYRFGGNVAGGYCESKNGNTDWSCDWRYASHIGRQIDNSKLWQGEVVIPWKALGLDGPKPEGLSFNFGRSWFLPEVGTWASLPEDGDYIKSENYIPLVCAPDAPAARVTRQGVPDFGKLDMDWEFFSPVNAMLTWKAEAAKSNGTMLPYTVLEKPLKLAAGVPQSESLEIPIERIGYDRLVFSLTGADGKVWMRQIVPFALNEQFAEIQKSFTKGKITAKLRQEQLRAKFGSAIAPVLRITAPDGKVKVQKAVGKEKSVELNFDRRNARGDYKFEIVDGKNNVLYTTTFFYPGIGPWENVKPDNRIIPPFTALISKKLAGGLEASPWGRTYRWEKSAFPKSVTAQNRTILAAPVTLSVNGKEYRNADFKAGTTLPHRDEFEAAIRDPGFTLSGTGWIEYDGVSYSDFTLAAKQELKNVTLKITLPAALAKYLHTAAGSTAWGQKITEKIQDGERVFRWYPVVWLGDEEGGFCFFTETRKGWTHPAATCCRIVKNGETATLEIRIADTVKAGEKIPLELGFLATPVKPLPDNYPLDICGDHYVASLHRPGRRPTGDPMLTYICAQYEISECFWDLPSPETSEQAKMGSESAKRILSFGSRPIPYHQARYLSDEYPEVRAYLDEWKIMPELSLDYTRGSTRHKLHDCCPRTAAADFYVCKYREMLQRYPDLRGLYFDFGIVPTCSNPAHGCDNRVPLLGLRDYYRKICLAQLDAGIEKPLLMVHNTDEVQVPAFTFTTHLFNGEHIRQHSSTMLHNGRDILDNYDETMFASELGSLPFGITNSDYHAQDVLIPEFGGGKEDPELYKFRLTLAMLAGTLPHNTIASSSRMHYGIYDKLVRIYDEFDVPKAHFTGYWRKPAEVLQGKDIFVSVYRHPTEKRALAVISHIGKEHVKQTVKIRFSPDATGLTALAGAAEQFTKPDPDYSYLKIEMITKYGYGPERAPLKLGDFGVKVIGVNGMDLELELDFHKVALVELR